MSHAAMKRPFMSIARVMGLLRLAVVLAVAACAPHPYNPDAEAGSLLLMQTGLQMMQRPAVQVHQSSCHWFGSQWVCNGY
jgi:hypothetical protein